MQLHLQIPGIRLPRPGDPKAPLSFLHPPTPGPPPPPKTSCSFHCRMNEALLRRHLRRSIACKPRQCLRFSFGPRATSPRGSPENRTCFGYSQWYGGFRGRRERPQRTSRRGLPGEGCSERGRRHAWARVAPTAVSRWYAACGLRLK